MRWRDGYGLSSIQSMPQKKGRKKVRKQLRKKKRKPDRKKETNWRKKLN